MTTTIAYTSLLAAALLDLCAMLLHEVGALQHNDFSNSRYYSWLSKSDDLMAPRRLVVLAVLIGCCTTMAQSSWMVIALFAATLLAQGIILLCNRSAKPSPVTSHARLVYGTAIVLALLATAAGYILGVHLNIADAVPSAASVAVIALALSPLLAMLANWLLSPLRKSRQDNGTNT